jgi:hypothetical protein
MKELDRLVTIVVGAVVLFVAYDFWTGSGYFEAYFFPAPDADGNVSTGDLATAGFFSSLLELVAWLLSSVGTLAILVFMGLVRAISRALEPLFGAAMAPAGGQAPAQAPAGAGGQAAYTQPTDTQRVLANPGDMQRAEDTARLLVAAAAAADRRLTIALAESLAGRPYLTVADTPVTTKALPKAWGPAAQALPDKAEPTTPNPRAKK